MFASSANFASQQATFLKQNHDIQRVFAIGFSFRFDTTGEHLNQKLIYSVSLLFGF